MFKETDKKSFTRKFNNINENDINFIKREENIEIKKDDKTNIEKYIYENRYDNFGNLIYYSKVRVLSDETAKNEIEMVNKYNELNKVEMSKIIVGDYGFYKQPDVLTYKYSYDDNGNLETLTLVNGLTQKFEYDTFGRIKTITYNNKVVKHINYSKGKSNLISSVIIYDNNGKELDNMKYTYDEKGNILKIFQNNNEKVKYFYDEFSRIIREDNKELNKTLIFNYDNKGNIIEKYESKYTQINTDKIIKHAFSSKSTTISEYKYTKVGNKELLLSFDNDAFVYDFLGNPVIYRNSKLKWNYSKNIEKIGNLVSYKYNSNGIRVAKVFGNYITKFYLVGNTIIAQDDGYNKINFHYGIDGLTGFSFNGKEYFYKKNLQNDIVGINDIAGKQIVKYVYDILGNHRIFVLFKNKFVDINSCKNKSEDYLSVMEVAELNPFRYHSYYLDEETGLYYTDAKYYDAELGKYINNEDKNLSFSLNRT